MPTNMTKSIKKLMEHTTAIVKNEEEMKIAMDTETQIRFWKTLEEKLLPNEDEIKNFNTDQKLCYTVHFTEDQHNEIELKEGAHVFLLFRAFRCSNETDSRAKGIVRTIECCFFQTDELGNIIEKDLNEKCLAFFKKGNNFDSIDEKLKIDWFNYYEGYFFEAKIKTLPLENVLYLATRVLNNCYITLKKESI